MEDEIINGLGFPRLTDKLAIQNILIFSSFVTESKMNIIRHMERDHKMHDELNKAIVLESA